MIIVISGWFGILFIAYILFEIAMFSVTRTLFIHKLFIGLKVRREVKKMLPQWWYIERIHYITINKARVTINKKEKRYGVYIKVRSKIPTGGHQISGDNTCWTNDWVIVNWLGEIKNQNFMNNIEYEDRSHVTEIKQWSRDNALEKLGI